jgi:hypothetical protein
MKIKLPSRQRIEGAVTIAALVVIFAAIITFSPENIFTTNTSL